MAKLLNIEVGEKIVRVCVASKKGKGAQISDSFRFATPKDTVTDGAVSQPEVLAEELRSQLSSHGLSGVKAANFVLASTKIASREVLLPPVKENRIKSVVEANAHEYFPVDLAGYQVAHCLLENVKEPEPGARVLVTAVPKQTLMSYSKLADAAGLTISGFDYAANGQYQLLAGAPTPGITMYANVGTNQTIITFMQDGKLLLLRTFPFGGDDTMHELVSGTDKADADFMTMLELCENSAWVNENTTAEVQIEAFSRLVNGISRSADFFKSSYKGVTVDKVVIMGACSGVAGLCEAISHEIGLETTLLKNVDGIGKVANVEIVTFYASVIGSAIAPLDLIPDEMKQKKSKGKGKSGAGDSITSGLILLIAGAGIGGFFAITTALDVFEKEDRLDSINARIAELSYVEQSYDMYIQYQAVEANMMILERDGENYNAELRAFIEELERKMPSSLLALAATCTEEGIALNVQVADMDDAAVTISQLRAFDSVQDVSVDSITESADDLGVSITEFTISAIYNELEPIEVPTIAEPEAEAPAAE